MLKPKSQNEFFAAKKSLRALKLLRVLSESVPFESSVIGSSEVFFIKIRFLVYIIFLKRRSH